MINEPTSNQDWFYGLSSFLILGFSLVIVELIRRHFHWSGEVTRKITHIGTGLLVFISPLFLISKTPAVALGIFFTIFNYFAIRFHWLKGIHGTNRTTYGTAWYPLAFSLLAFLCWDNNKPALMTAMLVLAIGDASAALIGGWVKKPHLYNLTGDTKSLEGSAGMFLVSFCIILIAFYFFDRWSFLQWSWPLALVTALTGSMMATASEAVSVRGSDNMTIPLSVALVVHVMTHSPDALILQFFLASFLSLGVSLISYYVRFLNVGGAAAAFILGTIIFGLGGWPWAAPILVFFVSSSILSRLGKRRKKKFDLVFEKSSTRDVGQVMANGGLAGCIMVLAYYYPDYDLYLVFLGILAAVTSDTWATEIGVWFTAAPRNILNLRKVEAGTSGGVTLAGTFGGVLGALCIAVSGYVVKGDLFLKSSLEFSFFWIILAGFIGSTVDSILGATFQAQYLCEQCKKVTERKVHCDRRSTLIRGWEFFHNDRVNLMCGLSGGLVLYFMTH
ncbi:DUF92 domain-containing protein [bacterium]|nr:DUF92 domain-containing protein [bacterium]